MVLQRAANGWQAVHVQTAGRAMKPGELQKFQFLLATP
jgi:hypothetical protein